MNTIDDDDEFLYGGSAEPVPLPTVPQPIPLDDVKMSTGAELIEQLEQQAQQQNEEREDSDGIFSGQPLSTSMLPSAVVLPLAKDSRESSQDVDRDIVNGADADDGEQEEQDEQEEEESDDDIEIILDRPSHSLDLRPGRPTTRPTTTPRAPAPAFTTEYSPIQRGGAILSVHPPPLQAPSTPLHVQQIQQTSSTTSPSQAQPHHNQIQNQNQQYQQIQIQKLDGPDPNTLPAVTAPPSHPEIDPDAVGMFDGRSILEVDLGAMADKPWRRPGSDISDWFNYGFDEISWEAYCYRRRELGDIASVLKTNVINFAGMGEDQITALPPELRQMVMTGTSAMMSNGMQGNPMNVACPSPAMMNPQMMMEMQSIMMNMGVQDMATAAQIMQQLQQQQQAAQDGAGIGASGSAGGGGQGGAAGPGLGGSQDTGAAMMMQEGYPGAPGGVISMGGMGGADYGMQMQDQNQMQIYPTMDGSTSVGGGQQGPVGSGPGTTGGLASSTGGASIPVGQLPPGVGGTTPALGVGVGRGTGGAPLQTYRAASNGGAVAVPGSTAAGGGGGGITSTGTTPVAGRGGAPLANIARGRGGFVGGRGRGVVVPVRPASPLPPNVPTGPRNQNKYRDRDGNAPAVDGLDYGGGGGGGSGGVGSANERERDIRDRDRERSERDSHRDRDRGDRDRDSHRDRDRDRDRSERDRDRSDRSERDRERERDRSVKEDGRSRRTPSAELEDRSSSRKRRSSPGLEDTRPSKRR